ncbi:uncharacterized protein [Triticum aestivum]|uniref:uncharacterized protein n=1 Tax=Triticum aestivum TaxID=4565 RepID=UPI001D0318E5|nr:uncharacterized protein LOC123080337 [Triticum aestivum]
MVSFIVNIQINTPPKYFIVYVQKLADDDLETKQVASSSVSPKLREAINVCKKKKRKEKTMEHQAISVKECKFKEINELKAQTNQGYSNMARRLTPVKQSHGSGRRCPCRIQLSPTSCAWILPGRAVASADKLLYETRRVGIGAAASGRMLCPNRANALEKAICGFAENPGDNLIVSKLVQALICLPQSGQGITGNGR